MILRVDLFYYLCEDAVFIEDEGRTHDAHVLPAVHALFAPGTERLDHFSGCVCKEGERERMLFLEILVRLHTVLAYADHIISLCYESLVIVAQVTCLCCATACVVLRIEVDDGCLLYTSPSPRDRTRSRMPSSA